MPREEPIGMCCLHVDDLFITGTPEFLEKFKKVVKSQFKIGHEDVNDLMFTGQRVKWIIDEKTKKKSHITVEQSLCVSELTEVVIPKGLKDEDKCDKDLHTAYRSLLGSINWLQSRTQFQSCYQFSRCASAAAAPTIGDCKTLNKLCRQIVGDPMELMFWPLQGDPRLVAMPDAAFRNNSDKSSQRAMVIFMAEPRKEKSKNTRGSLIFFESTKIKRTTLSTTVAELYALMKCYGICQMLRGLIKDITGLSSEIHMRTDANNLVTTASTTHVPEQQETIIHMIQMLRKEACSGSIADLSHIRTQWCLADCLTKKSANPQNLIDAVRQGVLKEVDAHPPFRSLLEHKAYLRSWLPTVCSHVDFRHDVFLLGDTLRDSWLFFEFVPAAQEAESRGSHCFFNMSSSSRWNRTSAAASSDQAQSNTRGQEYYSSRIDATGTHSSDGYALRRSEEIPDDYFRTPSTLPEEDHLAFCYNYRRQTDWFHAHENVRKRRERNLHTLMGPHNMRATDKYEMFMDAIAWILHWGTSHGEFDESLKWTSSFLKYLCGFTTQAEEDWFDGRCNDFHVDMTSSSRKNYYMSCSKKLPNVLRHCRDKTLFTTSGAMNISILFDQMQDMNPKEYHMSGADFAAMLLCNPKQRFFVEISMRWKWFPYSPAATYPFDVRLGAFQGHSKQFVDPTVAHHQLTYDEAMSLGWIFHVTDHSNLQSIQQTGLMTNVKGSGKGGRDAVHFMYHNDNGHGYIRMAEGTKPPRTYRRPVYLVLDPSFLVNNKIFLTRNGVVLHHGDVPFQYLHVKEQLPTIACNVIHQGRGHSLPPSVTGGSWHANTTWNHVMKEKGPSFIPGQEIPDEVRITAWQFMGQQVPQNYGRWVFGAPLCNERDFDPIVESIYGVAAESSQEREASAQVDETMENPYEQPSRRGRSPEREEPQDAWEQQRSSSGSSEPPQHDDPQQDAQDNQQEEPSVEVQDDPMGEEVVNLWEAEDPPDDIEDPVVEQATKSSISASNPWVLYEAGIICAREENGELIKNSSGEKSHSSQRMEPSTHSTEDSTTKAIHHSCRLGEASMDRTFMPTLHQSLGDWTHVGTFP